MDIYIDCEWNGFGGELISIALCAANGDEFYEVLGWRGDTVEWVSKNVVPVLWKGIDAIPDECYKEEAQQYLHDFLFSYEEVTIISDWPEDIERFCDLLITGPGTRIETPPLTMKIAKIDAPSEVPHNALWDARGIRDYMENIKNRLGGVKTMKAQDLPAMPTQINGGDLYGGLTKREYYAALAMQGLISSPKDSPASLADDAVSYADALLERLDK